MQFSCKCLINFMDRCSVLISSGVASDQSCKEKALRYGACTALPPQIAVRTAESVYFVCVCVIVDGTQTLTWLKKNVTQQINGEKIFRLFVLLLLLFCPATRCHHSHQNPVLYYCVCTCLIHKSTCTDQVFSVLPPAFSNLIIPRPFNYFLYKSNCHCGSLSVRLQVSRFLLSSQYKGFFEYRDRLDYTK